MLPKLPSEHHNTKYLRLKPKQRQHLTELNDLLAENDTVLLACSTGYGKTVVGWQFIRETLTREPKARFLILTHGKKEIRHNFAESKAAANHFVIDNPKDFAASKAHNVVICLPQTIQNHLQHVGKFHYLIFDEAHHYYSSPMVQHLIAQLRFKKQVLLTSTHYDLNLPKVFCSRELLLRDGDLVDVKVQIIPSDISINFYTDYVRGDLREDNDLPEDFLKNVCKLLDSNRQTMIVVHNIKSADLLHKILIDERYDCDISHHQNDPSADILRSFKSGEMQILIVVQRGNIGFDYPELATILDLSFSKNIERLEQIFGRLCRVPERAVSKRYIKVVPLDFEREFRVVMAGVLALGVSDIYQSWNGKQETLKIIDDIEWLYNDVSDKPFEITLSKRTLQSFAEYCEIFRKRKNYSFITLSDALKRIRTKTNWLTYEGCKSKASEFTGLADWQRKHPTSHKYALQKQWARRIAKAFGWEYTDEWIYYECLQEAKPCRDVKEFAKIYPDNHYYVQKRQWLEYLSEDLGWT